MLSIQPLKSASGAANYYLNVVNYYSNDSKSIRWLGEGAKDLGIHGKLVEKELMQALLQGTLPDGTQLGRIDKEGIHHRPGFDMTVSAPKSFSILLESGADPRLAEALDKTVEWFVAEMEQEFAQARLMVNGEIEYVDTKNFVVAAFRQPNSRANEPQSHVHLVAMNMTQCKDGKWRSLASDMSAERGVVEQIMKNHIYGGLKFRNKLGNITKELGYTLETTGDGLWEIKGVPKEVRAFFSTRREDIEQYMKEHGLQGARAASIATQRTKTDKEIVDFAAWKKEILTTCKSFGFDALQFVARIQEPKNLFSRIKESVINQFFDKEKFQTIKGDEAVTIAIESVSQQTAVFTPQKIKEHALKHIIASDWVVDERYIDKAMEQRIASQKLLFAQHPITQKPMLTTPWQLQLESETIARIEKGKGAITPISSKANITSFIKKKEEELQFDLSPSQKNAMLGFLTSSDRFMAIQGYAGTGKTTMLKLTRELAEVHGYQLRGVTAGSSAASELQSKGGLSAATFARELLRLQKNKEDLTRIVFVVDEASMLSNPQGHKIMQLIDDAGSQLKIIGDRAQLPSPSSGRWFSLIQDYGIDTVQMTDNLRQEEGLIKESAIHASRGEIYDAVEKLTVVKARETYLARIEETANTWLNLSKEERKQTLCFAPTHKNRNDITEIIRHKLKEEGTLTGDTLYQTILSSRPSTSIELRESVYYTRDDVLRFNINIPRFNIKSGDYFTVQELSAKHKNNKSLCLLRENGRAFTFPLKALPEFKEANKDLERPVEIYRKRVIEIQAGDIIQWKRNDKALGINNSDLAFIQTISKDEITIQNQDNKLITLKLNAEVLKHLDHGYVLTTYGAQGKDKKRGVGLIESINRFSTTIENYYVETTRGISEMIVVTDDKDNLVKTITTRDSQKASALEFVDSEVLQQHAARLKPNELSLQSVIEKKQIRESEWNEMEREVTSYNEEKQNSNTRQASIHAAKIVKNKTCYRLALTRLSHSHKTYQRDALLLETAKLSKNLKGEDRDHFNTVKNYVHQSLRIAHRVKHTITHADTKNDKAMNQKQLQKQYNTLYQLAAIITKDLKSHQPWLTHFSIGEVNRLGVSQHHLRKENEKAYVRLEKLAERASLHQVRLNVLDYIKASEEQKPLLAHQIKRESKLSHRFIIDLASSEGKSQESLWKAIHSDARIQSDRLFRQGLSSEGKLAFDTVKDLKAVQQEIRASWSSSLREAPKEGTFQVPDSKTQQLIMLKNSLASQIINNPALMDVASYFKMDLNSLSKQSTQHHYRETVQQFVKSTSDFKTKLTLARQIQENVKSHYPFIVEANIDSKILGKYIRVAERQERYQTTSIDEAGDYKKILLYKMANHKMRTHWKAHYNLTPNERKTNNKNALLASIQSAKRDAIAFSLRQSTYLGNHLKLERIDCDKFNQQAESHLAKCTQINSINVLAEKLIHQYPSLENQKTDKAIAAWKGNWSSVFCEVTRIKNDPFFIEALKGKEALLEQINAFDQGIRKQYEIKEHSQSATKVNPNLRKINQSTSYLDARAINEALMVKPEETYKAIFGEPKSINAREMRFSGGLMVTLKGSKEGLWYDFNEGRGGMPIDAIMTSRQLDFKEALKIAADIAGFSSSSTPLTPIRPIQRDSSKINEEHIKQNGQLSARSIWEGSVPIKGTLAETYLKKHRGIKDTERLDVRFWPIGANWINCKEDGSLENKINPIPALIIPAKNAAGKLTGVQRIYLDKNTGGKNRFMDNPKLSKGTIEGSAAILQSGMKGSTIFIAEGPETAASISICFPTATVMTSLGISNIKNLTPLLQKLQGQEVIIAADFDGKHAKTSLVTDEVANKLKQEGFNVRVVYPEPVGDLKKTDWNDVLIHKGKESIQVRFSGVTTPNKADLFDINSALKADKQPIIRESIKSEMHIKNDASFKGEIARTQQRIKEMEMEL